MCLRLPAWFFCGVFLFFLPLLCAISGDVLSVLSAKHLLFNPVAPSRDVYHIVPLCWFHRYPLVICYSLAQVCAHDHVVLLKVSLLISVARDNFFFFLFFMNFLCSIIDRRLIWGSRREVLELVSLSQVIWPITLLYIAYSTSN